MESMASHFDVQLCWDSRPCSLTRPNELAPDPALSTAWPRLDDGKVSQDSRHGRHVNRGPWDLGELRREDMVDWFEHRGRVKDGPKNEEAL